MRAFDEAKVKMGRNPDFVCACAGASYPKFFLDHTMEDFEKLTILNYLGQAYVAHVSLQTVVNQSAITKQTLYSKLHSA